MSSIIFFTIGIVVAGIVFFLVSKFGGAKNQEKEGEKIRVLQTEMENKFNQLTQSALKNANEQFLTLALQKFGDQKEKIKLEMEGEKKVIGETVTNLNEQLKKYEALMKSFEADRDKKFGSIAQQMKSAAEATEKLWGTTNKLTNILGNVKLRGQWGEKMAEDILRYSGMIEGVNYKKNKAQDTVATRPDYIFLLPDNHKVYMDVKFPFNAYMDYINETNEESKEKHKKQFVADVKDRIKEITKRDYINPEENTLDYILMFVANEQVYAFMNENYPDLIEESLNKKVVLCSPWTLYAVLRIIRQAWDNYHVQQSVKEIIQVVNAFAQEYEKFKDAMDKHGKQIENAHDSFHTLKSTRQTQLDRKIQKIEELRKGQIENEVEDEDKDKKIDSGLQIETEDDIKIS